MLGQLRGKFLKRKKGLMILSVVERQIKDQKWIIIFGNINVVDDVDEKSDEKSGVEWINVRQES